MRSTQWSVRKTRDDDAVYILSATPADSATIVSASSSICPADKRACRSASKKLTNWEYWDNGKWKEIDDIKNVCETHNNVSL